MARTGSWWTCTCCPPGVAGGTLVGGAVCRGATCGGLDEFLQHLRKHISLAATHDCLPAHGYYALVVKRQVAVDIVLTDDPVVRTDTGTVYHLLVRALAEWIQSHSLTETS